MSKVQSGLGRGLDALFRNNEAALGAASSAPQNKNEISFAPLDALIPNPKQPRQHFAEAALEELAASIRSQGIVQPLLVRPSGNARYEIVAGERRWRAAKLAGLTEVPVLVRKLSDMEVMAAALIENLQREDLNPMEEAGAMAALKEQFGLSQEELASALGKSRPTVANALRLLNLSAEAREHLTQGRISAGHARAVLSLPTPEMQAELLLHIVQDALTVRDAEYAVTLHKEEGAFPWERAAAETASPLPVSALPVDTAPPLSAKKTLRKAKSLFLQNMQTLLRRNLNVRAGISGTEASGRISLTYRSREELYMLLQRLGVNATEATANSKN